MVVHRGQCQLQPLRRRVDSFRCLRMGEQVRADRARRIPGRRGAAGRGRDSPRPRRRLRAAAGTPVAEGFRLAAGQRKRVPRAPLPGGSIRIHRARLSVAAQVSLARGIRVRCPGIRRCRDLGSLVRRATSRATCSGLRRSARCASVAARRSSGTRRTCSRRRAPRPTTRCGRRSSTSSRSRCGVGRHLGQRRDSLNPPRAAGAWRTRWRAGSAGSAAPARNATAPSSRRRGRRSST